MKKYNLWNNILGWVCFLVAAVTYLLTIEPTASFWDCPEFISQGAKLEVGHPPGNPIFMLAARFFVTIFGNDISNAAVAVNSMSALLSAATILLLFWTITHLIRRIIVRDDADTVTPWQMIMIFAGGICGSLAYTWSDTFWFSAVEGEVYAFSSFCTALVFWLILKWENRADQPHSDRYLILIAYIIGVSIAVHLLNLLCIPAIVLVFYFRKFRNINAKGSLTALCISFVIVALILFGLVPGFVKVAQWFELIFVNGFGASYNTGVLFYACLLVALFIWAAASLYRQRNAAIIKLTFFLSIVLSGMLFIGPWWLATLLIVGLAVYVFGICKKVPVRIYSIIVMSVFLIFIGYSSYALLLIRSHANTPMNQNAPDNVFSLSSYLNREQYGEAPLFTGPVFAEQLVMQEYPEGSGNYYVPVDAYGRPRTTLLDGVLRDQNGSPYSDPTYTHAKVVKTRPGQPDEYIETSTNPNYTDIPDLTTIFPRVYSSNDQHVQGYKGWSQYSTPDINEIPEDVRSKWAEQGYAPLYELAPYLHSQTEIATAIDGNGNTVESTAVWKPDFLTNLRYFFNYQFSHMYWRYFMWNFAGRQNDIAGNGEPHLGNWISGIPAIDNFRLGDQSLLPDEYGKGNKGHNVFYMLPLLLGVIGLLWQAFYIKKDAPQRGIEQFWVVCFLFFMTGIAIVLYLNQTPGQPRERDYAFAGSFYAFAIWIGIGIPAIGMMLRALLKANRTAEIASAAVASVIALAIPLQMVSQTWDDHDRSGRYTTRDFGMNYLASVDENAIIFCNGDNDTFPLWYAQEVEGFRTDVRVINLSYLTQDWYADQQRIPSYEGQPVQMYAHPKDYAMNRLAYSFVYPTSDSIVSAKDALLDLYESPNRYSQPVMTLTNLRMDIDTAAVFNRYALDPESPVDSASIIPYMEPITASMSEYIQATGKGGLNLGNILALDIIANSVEGGFKRPVYFASTVPSSYYVGLTPYIHSTGMASEVTPFYDPEISPTALKAYENIVGKFRWGGLDIENPEKLYLDETVRRMVSSTRSAMMGVARELIACGSAPASQWAIDQAKKSGSAVPANRYDMGRILLDMIMEKLPSSAAPMDGLMAIYIAESYYDIYRDSHDPADLAKAKAILEDNLGRYAQFVKYCANLTSSQISLLGYDRDNIDNLGIAVALLNHMAVIEALEKNPAENEEIIREWSDITAVDHHPVFASMVYTEGVDEKQLESSLASLTGASYQIAERALETLRAHKAAGIDPQALTDKIIADYGIDIAAWRSLTR